MAEFTEKIPVEEKDFPYEKEEPYLQTYLNKIQSNTGDGFKHVITAFFGQVFLFRLMIIFFNIIDKCLNGFI